MSKKEFSFNLAEKMAQAKKDLGSSEETQEITSKKIEPSTPKKEKTKPSKDKQETAIDPKLFVSGRLNRKDCNYIARSLHISETLLNDINAHCKGSESAIYNYLLTEGLRKIKEASGMIHVDIKDMEGEGAS